MKVKMSNKILSYISLVFLLFLFPACSKDTFDGSKSGNENQFIMEYSVFTGTETRDLVLEDGDKLSVAVVSTSGKVNIEIGQSGCQPIYTGKAVPSSTFGLTIHQSGTYTVTIAGEKTKGSVSIKKKVG